MKPENVMNFTLGDIFQVLSQRFLINENFLLERWL